MREKVIFQHDERDCGAACLSMIANHYGLKQSISAYRELTKTDKTGTNLYGLVDGAKNLGLNAVALSGSADELADGIQKGEIHFPFIAHTISDGVMRHYIVVFGLKNGKFLVGDPEKGKLRLTVEDFYQRWTGYIVTFEKTEAFRAGNHTRGGFLKFFRLLKGQWGKMVGVMAISLVVAAIGVMGAFVFQIVIDEFATDTGYYKTEDTHDHEDEDTSVEADDHVEEPTLVQSFESFLEKTYDGVANASFHLIFIALIVLYFLQAAIQFARGYLIASISKKIDIRLSLSYYNHIVDLPVSSISVRQTGEYLSRFFDTATIRSAISGATLTLLLDSVMVIACGCILYTKNVKLFFASLLMIVFYAVIVLCYRKPVEQSNRTVMENNARLQSYFKESIDGIETVKASCANEQIKEATTFHFTRFVNSAFKNSLLSMSQDTLADAVEMIGTAAILWIGFGMVIAGQVTIGALMTFYVLLSYFTEPIKNLIELQPMIQTALVAADRLSDILDLRRESMQGSGRGMPEVETMEIQNVDFRYGNCELTLDNLSLSFQKGEKIAIVGESGSGKTTLAKLLLRFYEPERGSILLNGEDIRAIELSALRRGIAYVDQNTFLFADTIKNNLRLGNMHVTDAELAEACRISRADEFIRRLPLGFDTPLDENGMNLSGGQRQRLAIARALLRKPELLILDEATSNLDTITEASIKGTIDQIDSNMSCVIIAHRLTTVKSCDRIYVMDRGRIVESGTHEELLKKGGKYTELWSMQ